MTAVADRFDCAVCGKRIARRKPHLLTETDRVCCMHCVTWDSKRAHAVCYPDCPVDWHDMYDHRYVHCSLAALRWALSRGGYRALDLDQPTGRNTSS